MRSIRHFAIVIVAGLWVGLTFGIALEAVRPHVHAALGLDDGTFKNNVAAQLAKRQDEQSAANPDLPGGPADSLPDSTQPDNGQAQGEIPPAISTPPADGQNPAVNPTDPKNQLPPAVTETETSVHTVTVTPTVTSSDNTPPTSTSKPNFPITNSTSPPAQTSSSPPPQETSTSVPEQTSTSSSVQEPDSTSGTSRIEEPPTVASSTSSSSSSSSSAPATSSRSSPADSPPFSSLPAPPPPVVTPSPPVQAQPRRSTTSEEVQEPKTTPAPVTRHTITSGHVKTSSPVQHTVTSTLEDGAVTTLTSTSWVAVVPTGSSSDKDSSAKKPDLQNAAARPQGQTLVAAVLSVVVGFTLLA